MDKLFGSQCRVFRFLPFKVVFVQFDQKIGDALVFNHTLKLEIDFFSHSSKNSQEWAEKAILGKRFSVQSSRSLNRGSRNDCRSTLAKSDPLKKAAGTATLKRSPDSELTISKPGEKRI